MIFSFSEGKKGKEKMISKMGRSKREDETTITYEGEREVYYYYNY